MSKLDNKVAVITGGSSGIGLATAQRFIEEGAVVYVTGRRKQELEAAATKTGAIAVQGDASNPADLDRLYDAVRNDGRRVDVVVANAGTAEIARLEDVTDEHFDSVFNINVRSAMHTVSKALPLLNDGGSIVLVASVSGRVGTSGMSVYNASKAAVRSFARTWANELKGRNIRVNALSPGTTDTPNVGSWLDEAYPARPLGLRETGARTRRFLQYVRTRHASRPGHSGAMSAPVVSAVRRQQEPL
ncbi:SDR family NAD(P)-dependent oxidoreductase [Streptomyces sp. YC419]|uniref:SDR family NAD(P)-dependent oxidoreductase n=2 Tax=Streptomyces ureilyticus TaxID=1775131 RepID=A0ABX0DZV1_9ACTN|nr:SDR family NAD(P)-dependent oxidoreductase [Streptomyces ureilyticus]